VDPLNPLRGFVGGLVRQVLGEADRDPARWGWSGEDTGLFGPESVTWRVHGTPAMIIGGMRALFLQTLHPLAMAGVAEHSDYRSDPLGRLQRTGDFVTMTTYGTTARANDAIERVKAIHQRVRGTAPDGRRYDAADPHLVCWVHATEVDSFLAAYRRYGGGPELSAEDQDRYVDEMSTIAVRLGADPDEVPRSVPELRGWMRSVRPELRYGPQARSATRFLLAPSIPVLTRPPHAIVAAAALGLLPPWARRLMWLPPVSVLDPVVVRPAAWTLLKALLFFTEPIRVEIPDLSRK
jgi:uncharacterized protein (DUF2236 family)